MSANNVHKQAAVAAIDVLAGGNASTADDLLATLDTSPGSPVEKSALSETFKLMLKANPAAILDRPNVEAFLDSLVGTAIGGETFSRSNAGSQKTYQLS